MKGFREGLEVCFTFLTSAWMTSMSLWLTDDQFARLVPVLPTDTAGRVSTSGG